MKADCQGELEIAMRRLSKIACHPERSSSGAKAGRNVVEPSLRDSRRQRPLTISTTWSAVSAPHHLRPKKKLLAQGHLPPLVPDATASEVLRRRSAHWPASALLRMTGFWMGRWAPEDFLFTLSHHFQTTPAP